MARKNKGLETKIKYGFLDKPVVKNVLLGLIVVLIGVFSSLMGTWEYKAISYFWLKVTLLFVSIMFYIFLLVRYATREVNIYKAARILEGQNIAFEKALSGVISICQQSSQNVNKIIHEIIDEGKINLNIWNFDKQCSLICEKIYNLLCELNRTNKEYYVSYVRLDETVSKERQAYMCAYYNKNMERPSIYQARRSVDDRNGYFDMKLFKKNDSGIIVVIGREEINKVFNYEPSDKRQMNSDKYNQYLAIPVICEKEKVGKMVGLLEVTCLNKTKIADQPEEIREIASKYLVPYAYLMLLLHKLEKALVAQPKQSEGL